MNLWHLIGRFLIGALAGWILTELVIDARRFVQHLRTRTTPPARGQTWCRGREVWGVVTCVLDDGTVILACRTPRRHGTVTWGVPAAEWPRRVRRERLYLIEEA